MTLVEAAPSLKTMELVLLSQSHMNLDMCKFNFLSILIFVGLSYWVAADTVEVGDPYVICVYYKSESVKANKASYADWCHHKHKTV